MGYVPDNPIKKRVKEILKSGKLVYTAPCCKKKTTVLNVTKELLCVTLNIKYPTFQTFLQRTHTSYMMQKTLLYGGIISEKTEREYYYWRIENDKPKKKRKRKPARSKDAATRGEDKDEEYDLGTEEDGERALFDPEGDDE